MSDNKKNSGVFKEIIQPALVLCAIALVVTGCLVVTNYFTADLIAANSQGAAGEARKALLPDADKFVMLETGEDLAANNGVVDIYDAENGAGTIVTVTYQGYNAPCTVMVAFAPDGTIVGYTPLEQEETPGLGDKVFESPFKDQFTGKTGEGLTVVKAGTGADNEIVASTGATKSSTFLTAAIKHAREAFKTVKGVL